MKKKILLLLAIIGAIFASSTVGTLSSYMTQSNFGIDIVTDFHEVQ